MNTRVRLVHTAVWCLCLAIIVGVVSLLNWTSIPDDQEARRPLPPIVAPRDPGEAIDYACPIEDSGFALACQFTAPIRDPGSLREIREAVELRGRLGLAVVQAKSEQVRLPFRAPKDQIAALARLREEVGLLSLHEGRYQAAADSFGKALELGRPSDIPERDRARRLALVGIAALQRAKVENTAENPGLSSGIFPIARPAAYTRQSGSREAVKTFSAYLEQWPEDLRVRWLLNIAFMTLGEYPEGVPPRFLIPLDRFQSTLDVGRFENVAPRVGLTSRGPNQAGGSVFDDFNGDGLPDLFVASVDVDRAAALFINRGGRTFEDRAAGSGLAEQVDVVNVNHADFDNDGDLDVLLMRGGWEAPLRLSLLRNKGDGRFDDVTRASGLGVPISTGSAAWGDYDNDGLVDLFVCGEYASGSSESPGRQTDPRNRCRLYRNQGDGKFVDVAAAAGVINERHARGAAWGDYDDDGRLDLFVSNRDGPSRLYHNQGDGSFRDVAPSLDVTGPLGGAACWFWDYDNDGQLDLYVSNDRATLADTVAFALGRPVDEATRPRLYRNQGPGGFREVTGEVGLDRPIPALGCNFGDIDNDGYLDLYIGTGWRFSSSSNVPNRMFKNVEGRRFEDVTMSSATGHLQKGNNVSFADWDCDGDLDLFVQAGGPVPGDRSHNLLFRNPCPGRPHWLKIKLVGTTTNRSALGAKIRVDFSAPGGQTRSVHRTVGNNSSSGGNSLVQSIGLRDATSIAVLSVSWPASRSTQTFRDLAADQTIEITEGASSFRVVPQPSSP